MVVIVGGPPRTGVADEAMKTESELAEKGWLFERATPEFLPGGGCYGLLTGANSRLGCVGG